MIQTAKMHMFKRQMSRRKRHKRYILSLASMYVSPFSRTENYCKKIAKSPCTALERSKQISRGNSSLRKKCPWQ